MTNEPRHSEEYGQRQVAAAGRVLVDVHQVLASFTDCMVLVGGWVPELLISPAPEEPHIGSIDVDLALDAAKLIEGRYAELLKQLLDTRRYRPGEKEFQLLADVDLEDGGIPIVVPVEFLAPKDVKLKKNKPKLLENFRVLKADGCAAAFRNPQSLKHSGKSIGGADNTVQIQVASLPDFLVMKSIAIDQRDKPKDVYDLCFCLEHCPGGAVELAENWRARRTETDVARAITILEEKFASVDWYGPRQLVEFFNSPDKKERDMQARRAYEWVQQFLRWVKG